MTIHYTFTIDNSRRVSNEDFARRLDSGLPLWKLDQQGQPYRFGETFSDGYSGTLSFRTLGPYDETGTRVFVGRLFLKLLELGSREMRKTSRNWDERTISRPRHITIENVVHRVELREIGFYSCERPCIAAAVPEPPSHVIDLRMTGLLRHCGTDDVAEVLHMLESMASERIPGSGGWSGIVELHPSEAEIRNIPEFVRSMPLEEFPGKRDPCQ